MQLLRFTGGSETTRLWWVPISRTAASEVGSPPMQEDALEDLRSGPVLILPALHFILCILIEFTTSDEAGSWKWFPMGLVDLPFAFVLQKIAYVLSYFWAYAVFGTLVWYGVSIAFRIIYRKMVLDK